MKYDWLQAAERQVEWLKFSKQGGLKDTYGYRAERKYSDWRTGDAAILEKQSYELPLENGELFYVGAEMCELVRKAAIKLPHALTLQRDWIPAQTGFVYFAEHMKLPHIALPPLENPDAPVLQFKAMGWTMWREIGQETDAKLGDDDFRSEWGTPENFTGLAIMLYLEPTARPHTFMPISLAGWDVSQPLGDRIETQQTLSKKRTMHFVDNELDEFHPLRYFASLLLLMDQKLPQVTSVHLDFDRAARKRYQRENLEPHSNIQVIKLRSYVSKTEGQRNAEPLDHPMRWIVRGHWRMQWYEKSQYHKPIWIHPHVKGPEGKPIKEVDKLFAVVR